MRLSTDEDNDEERALATIAAAAAAGVTVFDTATTSSWSRAPFGSAARRQRPGS
jgi:hypothetical protein